uniref:Prolamin-like domain-containing protein n=1 Tax=Fagus sylvatica TaxID=28930 RepID=A0A2N9J8C2_FAGSY
MATKNVFILLVLIVCLLANETGAIDLPIKPDSESVSRFQVNGDHFTCLKLLMGMKSCTIEIIDFLSGMRSNIDSGCCRSISSISKYCQPSTWASLCGFTAELRLHLQLLAQLKAPSPTAGSAKAPSPTAGSSKAPSPTAGSAKAPSPTAGSSKAPSPTAGSSKAPSPIAGSAEAPSPTAGSDDPFDY